ncbi:MAG TPA: redoxin family protein [Gemmata sp.]|nr:redoxin family protein [Gemmata sp.]
MRAILAGLFLVGLTLAVQAQDTKPAKQEQKKPEQVQAPKVQPVKKEPTLKVGDAAPELSATKWLQGTAVKEFVKDHAYVVEFWATWCGPCIVMMPHMGEMQTQYQGKVTFIGYSAKDPNNSEEKVAAFVAKRGPKLGYTFAYADDRTIYDKWMKAAAQNGIPCSFVVGKDGKIAYIGHPMYLDVVLPKVVAGTWSAEDVEGLKQVEKDVNNVFRTIGGKDIAVAEKNVAEFESKYPALSHIPYFVPPKIELLIKTKKFDDAQKMAMEVMAKAEKKDDSSMLRNVSAALRTTAGKGEKELTALSLKAAEAALNITGETDAMGLYYVAEAHFAAGDKAKAQEMGKKALEAAEKENPRLKAQLEKMVKKYED